MNPANALSKNELRESAAPATDGGSTREHHRSLRSKLVLGVAAILCTLFMLHEMVRKRIIHREFAALEQQEAIRDVNRVLSAIRSDIDHLSELAEQASRRADLTRGPGTSNPAALASHRHEFDLGSADWAFLTTDSGSVRWLRTPAGLDPTLDIVIEPSLKSLIDHARQTAGERGQGITEAFDNSLALFVTVPIPAENESPSDREQPSAEQDLLSVQLAGDAELDTDVANADTPSLVVGRTFNKTYIDTLRSRTRVQFSIERVSGERRLDDGNPTVLAIRLDEDTTTHVVMPLLAFDSRVLADLLVEVPREISSGALRINGLVRNYFLFGSVAALLALLWLLQRIVVAPVVAIREHTERIAEQGLETEPLVIAGNDEIGELAKAYDRMTERLSEAQRGLSESSRAAGARQVAETVIHNIGNVLTNVNSLLDSANAQVTGLRVQPLDRLAERLESSIDDPEFLEATPDYLRSLADSLSRDQQTLGELLGTLGGNLRHIHDVIRAQRRYARPSVSAEPLVVGDLIRESIDCCRARLERDHVDVQMAGALHETIRTDRSMLLQVFINVVGNAGDSLQMKPGGKRELRVEIIPGEETLQINFTDNGAGMDRTTLQRAFDAHFTTRTSGTGLGLHFCALAISRLGGGMRAMSDGPGQGAMFVIELPRVPPTTPASAPKSTISSRQSLEVGA
jgi:signal transduction histidine kinase